LLIERAKNDIDITFVFRERGILFYGRAIMQQGNFCILMHIHPLLNFGDELAVLNKNADSPQLQFWGYLPRV